MLNKEIIETDLVSALKQRNSLEVDTLRGLKTRIQNEQINKGTALTEDEVLALVRSEVKRRKEAAQTYEQGGRAELAEKEMAEAAVLEKYLPQGPAEADVVACIQQVIAENAFTTKDFGQVMGKLKQQFPQADGAMLSGLVKQYLK